MEFFIKIENGEPVDHPILAENLMQAFPNLDLNDLPDWLAKFEKTAIPKYGVYDFYEGATYEFDGEVVKEVHNIRPMTPEEKLERQNIVKSSMPNYEELGYTFSEELCELIPPPERQPPNFQLPQL